MVKSNMGAAKMRRTNRRIQYQANAIRETQARIYETRTVHKEHVVFSWMGRISRAIRDFATKIFGGIFSTPMDSIRSLSLLHNMDMGPNQHRGAGAAQLRTWFGQQLKMISTRDGKPV